MAAVGGAVQVLRCPIDGLVFDEHTYSCTGVELGNGQLIRCSQLAGDEVALREWLVTFAPRTTHARTHRCLAVLDAPLCPGEHQSMLVVPPGVLADGATPAVHAVRGLVLSSSTAVCPQSRRLLYLWTAADSTIEAESELDGGSSSGSEQSAREVLWPILQALVDVTGLEPGSGSSSSSSGGGAASLGSQHGNGMPSHSTPNGISDTASDTPSESSRPTALLAAFYTQNSVRIESYGDNGRWPRNVALCPGPDASATYVGVVAEAKASYARYACVLCICVL